LTLTPTSPQDEGHQDAPRPRRRWVAGAAAVAATVIAGTVLVTAGDSGDKPGSDLDASAATTTVASASAPDVDGLPPTREQLAGLWYEDSGSGVWAQPILAEFGADGTFSLGGVLHNDSWLYGTYEVGGHRITFTVAGGACGSRDDFGWDAGLVADGRFEAVHAGAEGDDPGQVGDCAIPVGEPYNFTKVSPLSPATAGVTPGSVHDAPVTSDTSTVDLEGYWLVEQTGYVLRLDSSGQYRLDALGDLGDAPQDLGTVEIGDQTLTFTSGGDAHGCADGSRMVWGNVRVEDARLRATVGEDTCGRGLSEIRLVLLNVGLP
jgi:hypothetical protein